MRGLGPPPPIAVDNLVHRTRGDISILLDFCVSSTEPGGAQFAPLICTPRCVALHRTGPTRQVCIHTTGTSHSTGLDPLRRSVPITGTAHSTGQDPLTSLYPLHRYVPRHRTGPTPQVCILSTVTSYSKGLAPLHGSGPNPHVHPTPQGWTHSTGLYPLHRYVQHHGIVSSYFPICVCHPLNQGGTS